MLLRTWLIARLLCVYPSWLITQHIFLFQTLQLDFNWLCFIQIYINWLYIIGLFIRRFLFQSLQLDFNWLCFIQIYKNWLYINGLFIKSPFCFIPNVHLAPLLTHLRYNVIPTNFSDQISFSVKVQVPKEPIQRSACCRFTFTHPSLLNVFLSPSHVRIMQFEIFLISLLIFSKSFIRLLFFKG